MENKMEEIKIGDKVFIRNIGKDEGKRGTCK
jgi:hypothetical protein